MTPKGHGVTRHRDDLLYDPKGHGDLCWVWPSLWPRKVKGSIQIALTYFDLKGHNALCGRFDLVYDPKMSWVIRGSRDLFFDPKVQLDLDLGYDPKRSRDHKRSRWPTLWPQRSTWPWPWPKGQAFDLIGDHRCPGNTIMQLGSHGVPYFQSM